jgi:hypothetical protein
MTTHPSGASQVSDSIVKQLSTVIVRTVIVRLDRTIQYSSDARLSREAAAYWIARRSLSSGGAMRRPGGGR